MKEIVYSILSVTIIAYVVIVELRSNQELIKSQHQNDTLIAECNSKGGKISTNDGMLNICEYPQPSIDVPINGPLVEAIKY